jgi:hypothetical protein
MTPNSSPVLRALVEIVAEHGPLDREEITARLNRRPLEDLRDKFGASVVPTSHWVSRALHYLQQQGRVRRDGKARGQTTWVAVPEAKQMQSMPPGRQARAPMRLAEAKAVADGPVVPPRRINVMEGFYEPKPFTPARPGAMQYAQVPSLHMGHRRTFRSEAAGK